MSFSAPVTKPRGAWIIATLPLGSPVSLTGRKIFLRGEKSESNILFQAGPTGDLNAAHIYEARVRYDFWVMPVVDFLANY